MHFKYVANQISLNVTPAVDRLSAEIIFQWWRPNVTAHGVQVQALSGNHWYWFDTVPKCVLWWENDLKKRGHFTTVAEPLRQQVPTLYGSTLLCITSSDVVNPLFTSMETDHLWYHSFSPHLHSVLHYTESDAINENNDYLNNSKYDSQLIVAMISISWEN